MRKILLSLFAVLLSCYALAYDAYIDGIYYNLNSDKKEALVTYKQLYYSSYSQSVIIPSTVTYSNVTYSVTSIGYYAFYNCTGLTSIEIPNSVTSIGTHAFDGCTSLKKLIFEDGDAPLMLDMSYESSITCFKDCPIVDLYIGRNMYTIDSSGQYISNSNSNPFLGLQTLEIVSFGESVTNIPNSYFSKCTNLKTVEMSEGIIEIGYAAFSGCTNLQSISLPHGLKTINSQAFYSCSNLEEVIIPNNVTTIGSAAFYYSSALRSIIIEDGSEPLSFIMDGSSSNNFSGPITQIYLGRNIENYYTPFYSYSTFDLTIGKNVTQVGGKAFSDIKGINKLIIEKSDEDLIIKNNNTYNYKYVMPFYKTPIDTIYLDRNIIPVSETGSDIQKSPFAGVTSNFSVITGENITEMSDYLFYNTSIDSLSISNSVSKIGTSTFNGCSSLRTIVIVDGNNPLEISGSSSFSGCSLDSLHLGRNLSYSFQTSPFASSKERLTKLTIGSQVEEINNSLFSGFKNLMKLDFPESLKIIRQNAFYGCEGLTELTIPSSVVEIGQQAFDLCGGLKQVTFEDGEETLQFTATNNNLNNCFVNSPLEDIYLGRNISYQNTSPFFAIETIKSMTLGLKVTTLPDRAFAGCPNLKDVYSYAENVPTTGQVVFTPSYLPSANLYVSYALHDEYKTKSPWKEFGNMYTFEGLYDIVYIVDGEIYKKFPLENGTSITPEADPEDKEGYTFSGWSDIPETMPAKDVTIEGTFSINSYKLTYLVDGEEYQSSTVKYGDAITPIDEPKKEGFIFSGWSEIPETMPAKDVIVEGTFTPDTTGMDGIIADEEEIKAYFNMNGQPIPALQKGMNIVKKANGQTIKVFVK